MKLLRRYLPHLVLLLMLVGSITSCRDAAVRDALVRAEALMESDPHAARAILDSIASPNPPLKGRASESTGLPSFRRGKGEAALYALLRTQADYKSGEKLTSDSLIRIAVDYYGTKRKSQHAALAQHYLGCTYLDMRRDLDAIEAQLRATTLFPDTTNKYFANSLFNLGVLYSLHHLEDSAWVVFRRYRQTEVCQSDSENISYADYYMGSVALYVGRDDVADSLFRCVEHNTKSPKSIRYNTYFQLAKQSYYHRRDAEEAIAYLNKIGHYFGEKNGAVLQLKADVLAEQHQPEQAFDLYEKVIQGNSNIYSVCSAYEGLAGIASQINKGDSTRFYFEKYKLLLDSIYIQSQKEKIAEIKDKHIVELHDQQLKARHARFMFWMGILAVALLSGTAITFLLIDRKRKKRYLQAQEELRQANVEVLRAQVNEQPADLDTLYRKKLAACQDLFRRTPSARLLLVPPASLTAAQRQTLMDDLTRSFVDIMLDVKNASNAVNDQELMYCVLSSLQCSTAQMAELLNNADGTLRSRKARLKEKMPENLYLLFFS